MELLQIAYICFVKKNFQIYNTWKDIFPFMFLLLIIGENNLEFQSLDALESLYLKITETSYND